MFALAQDSLSRALIGTFGTVVCAGACLAGAAGPAHAASVADAASPRSAVVSYRDLDLSHAQGQQELDARIKTAAHRVCATNAGDLASRIAENRCVDRAVGRASAKLHFASAGNEG